MRKILFVAVVATISSNAVAIAGSLSNGLLRAPYITDTGATVPKPGLPQASETSRLDFGIRHRDDDVILNSICRGC